MLRKNPFNEALSNNEPHALLSRMAYEGALVNENND
jgi:hypothetical protein